MAAINAATRARTNDHRLSFLDPVVEGARNAVVKRHRARRARDHGHTRGGDSGCAEQNSPRESSAIDQIHSMFPPFDPTGA
jgi:hypothetical protein